MLNMNVKEIKSLISLKEEHWDNSFETNCYAFALSLDIPESDIDKNACTLGIMASHIFNIPLNVINKMSFEEKLLLDLKALKISAIETTSSDKSYYKFIGNYESTYWIVALMCNDNNFHFLRKSFDNKWYHKIGYFGIPTIKDTNNNVILNPESCSICDYKYIKT